MSEEMNIDATFDVYPEDCSTVSLRQIAPGMQTFLLVEFDADETEDGEPLLCVKLTSSRMGEDKAEAVASLATFVDILQQAIEVEGQQ